MKKKIITLVIASFLTSSLYSQNTWTGSTISTLTSGAVGIGNSSPQAKLDIHVITAVGATYPSGLRISNANGNTTSNIMEILNGPFTIPATPPTLLFSIRGDGLVNIARSLNVANSATIANSLTANSASITNSLRIGSSAASGPYANYKLSVAGDMIAKRCVVEIDYWADYVFNDDYELPELSSVEKYINENNHLPGVPSEQEVKAKGIDVGEMNKILMQKVEELTLYMIQLKKENKEIKRELEDLDKN